MSTTQHATTWVKISKSNLIHNIKGLRRLSGPQVILAPCVKANAYGHGLLEVSSVILGAGADWLCVNTLEEAKLLRKNKIHSPIYILGYVMQEELVEAIKLDCRIVVYNKGTILRIAKEARKMKKKAFVHIKLETGNNRQGVLMHEIEEFVLFAKKFPEIEIEGFSTHFSNIEDTEDPSYAEFQLDNFNKTISKLEKLGVKIRIKHCANSAATILLPKTHFEMVRPGIAVYGLWPSQKVKEIAEKREHVPISLRPVLSWKTRIAQIKAVPKGAYVGYGCSYKTKRETRLAVLPVGYYEGYDRDFSSKGHVLIHGKAAPVRGRVCMNMTMVDVTDIPGVGIEDVATLIGKDGREEITADQLADLAGTINYEITTRINEKISRIVV